jgi:hypothetical protein
MLGDVVGEPSAGTNGNVNPFMLPGGYSVSWTGMLVRKRDGTPHHGSAFVQQCRCRRPLQVCAPGAMKCSSA